MPFSRSSDLSVFSQLAEITSCLYLSGARGVHYSTILERGITCVVNATIELPDLIMPGVQYVKIAVDDNSHCNLYRYFDEVADKILDVKRKGGKTLVHCIAGVSRSASLCIAYLMKHESMSLRQAYQHVKKMRPIIRPNPGFFRQLIDYEKKLYGHETVKMISSVDGPLPDVYDEASFTWLSSYQGGFNNYRMLKSTTIQNNLI